METSLIFDLNNLAARCFFTSEIGGGKEEIPEWKLWEYFVFNSIFESINYHKNIKEIILAVDGKNSWRKLIFPRYKEDRKIKRDKDEIDWDLFYEKYLSLCNSIKEKIPFKVIQIDRTEADDVIAVLAKSIKNNVVIISNDSDYLQLCDKDHIKVYNPSKQEYMKLKENVNDFVTKLCLTGQSKDNIFNCKTPNDYPYELRKPGLGEKTAEKILKDDLDKFLRTEQKIKKTYKNELNEEILYESEFKPLDLYLRNRTLIDFNFIPMVIQKEIEKKYNEYELPNPEGIYSFFSSKGWTGFLEDYDSVEMKLLKLY